VIIVSQITPQIIGVQAQSDLDKAAGRVDANLFSA